jgi:Domain of unknown function (DUF4397)
MKLTTTRRRIRLVAASALCLGIALTGTALAGSVLAGNATASTSTSDDGWIRLAHLSPNTPPVDVYLYAFGNSDAFQTLKHVAYGTVSAYEPLAAGDYTVAMRGAGAAASSPAVLSADVDILPGHAYTVAGMGPESGLRLAVLDDSLTTPSGQALVRVIQASLKQNVVNVSFDGQTLANGLKFGSVSSYATVSPGTGTVSVSYSGDGPVTSSAALAAGTVHTLVVLDGASGLEVVDLVDAAGDSAVPAGGVATGFGGTAPHGPPSAVPWLVIMAAGGVLAVSAGVWLRCMPRLGT